MQNGIRARVFSPDHRDHAIAQDISRKRSHSGFSSAAAFRRSSARRLAETIATQNCGGSAISQRSASMATTLAAGSMKRRRSHRERGPLADQG